MLKVMVYWQFEWTEDRNGNRNGLLGVYKWEEQTSEDGSVRHKMIEMITLPRDIVKTFFAHLLPSLLDESDHHFDNFMFDDNGSRM